MLSTQFQNCAPVGNSGVSKTQSLSGINSCNLPPTLSKGPQDLMVSSGLGTNAGTVIPPNIIFSLSLGYSTQGVSFNCKASGVERFNVSCDQNNNDKNSNKVTLRLENECMSGQANVTLAATDNLCLTKSNELSFKVNLNNSCPTQIKTNNPDPELNDQFGGKVSMSGNYAVVMASSDNEKTSNAGAAYVYFYNGTTWIFKQKLMPTELTSQSELYSAAISGNTILLGAPFQGDHGYVYVYRFNGTQWIKTQTLEASVKNSTYDQDLFGYDLSVDGNLIAVGAPGSNRGDYSKSVESGAVFLFQDNGTTISEIAQLKSSNGVAHDYFGATVAVSGIRVAVGAPSSSTSDKTIFTGKSYLFTKNNNMWNESILNPGSDLTPGAQFGSAVDVDDSRVVVGAKTGLKTGGKEKSGVAFVFKLTNGVYNLESKLTPIDGADGNLFGASVALYGEMILVGAPMYSMDKTQFSGAVYQYALTSNQWVHKFKLVPRMNDRGTEDRFGESVGTNGNWMISGSRLDDEAGSDGVIYLNSGSIFFIKLP